MTGEIKSSSPDGRYLVRIYPWEARMSHWIETPELYDSSAGRTLFTFEDGNWSLDDAHWQNQSVVRLSLRKYPGDHLPSSFEVVIDCAQCSARLDGAAALPLNGLEAALEQAYRAAQRAWSAEH